MLKKIFFIITIIFVPSLASFAENKDKSIIYYFHTNQRCASCNIMENYLEKVYNESYKDLLDYKVINVSDKENKHLFLKYKLYANATVLSKIKDGKEIDFIVLNDSWSYLHNEEKYKKYLKKEIERFLF